MLVCCDIGTIRPKAMGHGATKRWAMEAHIYFIKQCVSGSPKSEEVIHMSDFVQKTSSISMGIQLTANNILPRWREFVVVRYTNQRRHITLTATSPPLCTAFSRGEYSIHQKCSGDKNYGTSAWRQSFMCQKCYHVKKESIPSLGKWKKKKKWTASTRKTKVMSPWKLEKYRD